MRKGVAATLLLAASLTALGASRYKDGAYGGLPWIVPDALDKGILPYVTVYRLDRMWEAKKAEAGDPKAVPKDYEWHIPASTLEGTRAVSRDILLAWQRLEERAYWHVMTRIHYQFGVTEVTCAVKKALWPLVESGVKLNPPKPEVSVGTPTDVFPEGYAKPLLPNKASAEGKLRLDWYTSYHAGVARVRPEDYCDDVGLDAGNLPFFPMISGVKIITPFGEITTPGYPEPVWIDMGEFEERARRGLALVEKKYVPEYISDVLKAVAPRGSPTDFLASLKGVLEGLGKGQALVDPEVYLPTAWSGHEVGLGATMTPVIRIAPNAEAARDLQKVLETLFTKTSFSDNLLGVARYAYFVPVLEGLVKRLNLPVPLPSIPDGARNALSALMWGDQYRDEKARGVWPLEELKRWLPPSLPQVHEALGYTSYHQVFSRLEFAPLPDPGQDWGAAEYAAVAFMRSLHVIHVPIIVDTTKPIFVPFPPFVIFPTYPDLPNIRPIFIAPYQVLYSGPRYYWDWVSVPDAYPIPRARGVPVPVLPLPKR